MQICRVCCVPLNSVLVNLWCVWILQMLVSWWQITAWIFSQRLLTRHDPVTGTQTCEASVYWGQATRLRWYVAALKMHAVTWNMKIGRQYGSTLTGSCFLKQIHRQTTKVSKVQTEPKKSQKTLLMKCFKVLTAISLRKWNSPTPTTPTKKKKKEERNSFTTNFWNNLFPNYFLSDPLVCTLHGVHIAWCAYCVVYWC